MVKLEKRLAPLPQSVSLAERNIVSGVMGSRQCDLSMLRAPFHREYANWPPEPNAVLRFTQKYGLLDWEGQCSGRSDVAGLQFRFHMEEWREHRAKFLSAWATASINRRGLPWEIVPDNFPLPDNGSTWMVLEGLREKDDASMLLKGPQTVWKLSEEGRVAYIYAQTTWQYLWILLGFEKRDSQRVCKNPDCPAPFFIARRKDQVFCGEDCAHIIVGRRWWKKHGNEWRQARKQPKLKG